MGVIFAAVAVTNGGGAVTFTGTCASATNYANAGGSCATATATAVAGIGVSLNANTTADAVGGCSNVVKYNHVLMQLYTPLHIW